MLGDILGSQLGHGEVGLKKNFSRRLKLLSCLIKVCVEVALETGKKMYGQGHCKMWNLA